MRDARLQEPYWRQEKLKEAMAEGKKDSGEIIDLEEFKSKKAWKPKII